MRIFPSRRHRQTGYSLLEVLLAVSVAIAVGSQQLNQIRAEAEAIQSTAVGSQLNTAGRALNTYIGLLRTQLINGVSISGVGTVADPGPRTCVNIITGQGPGWQCTITTETLQRTGILPYAFSGVNAYGSTYDYVIRVQGTAPDWRIDGIVRTTQPYTLGGQIRQDLIGQALVRAGSDSGAVINAGGTINGLSGAWSDDSWGFGTSQIGMLAYRVGYGASGFNALLRTDGSNAFTNDMNMDGNGFQDVTDVTAANDITAGRLITNTPRTDAIVLGANDAANQTVIGNAGDRLRIQAPDGLRMVDGAGSGTPLSAGDLSVSSVTARGTGIFAGALAAEGLATTNGQNIISTGAISADGDFITSDGSFVTSVGSFNTTNGNLSALGGTIQAQNLNIGGSASVAGGIVRFGSGGAGWFYSEGPNIMDLGGSSNLRIGGAGGCDLTGATGTPNDDCRVSAGKIVSDGTLTASKLRISAQQAPGAACLDYTFATNSQGKMMQCIDGVYTLMGGARAVTVRNSAVAFAGQQVSIACPAGTKMVGGGWLVTQRNTPATDPYAPSKSFGNAGTNSWTIENVATGHTAAFQAQVVCAQV